MSDAALRFLADRLLRHESFERVSRIAPPFPLDEFTPEEADEVRRRWTIVVLQASLASLSATTEPDRADSA